MNLLNALDLDINKKNVICLVGGGGKTTTMLSLSKELIKHNIKILLTTTTAIFYPTPKDYDNLIISSNLEQILLESKRLSSDSITIIGKTICNENTKLKGIDKDWVKPIVTEGNFDTVVIEADGAKRKPIKAPDWYEPVIPECSTLNIGCIGLDIIDQAIDEKCVHRSNIFCDIVDQKIGDTITYDTLMKLVLSENGLFKECDTNVDKIVLLNKVTNKQINEAYDLAKRIINNSKDISKVIIGNVRDKNPILKIVER